MNGQNARPAYDRAYEVRFAAITDNLTELKARVQRLELTLARGLMLLVANLAGVVSLLAQQLVLGR